MPRHPTIAERFGPQIIAWYKANLSYAQIAARLGISAASCCLFLKPLGLSRPRPCREDERRKMIEAYEAGATVREAGALVGRSYTAAIAVLRKAKVTIRNNSERHRLYRLDETVFDDPLTPAARYWVGFLMADGCSTTGSGGQRVLSLGLAAEDRAHVEKYRRFLGTDHPIYQYAKEDGQDGVILPVNSARLCDRLLAFGLAPRKSLTARVVGLETDRDFWRGEIDGDGSLYFNEDGRPVLSLIGSCAMMEQFAGWAAGVLGDRYPGISPNGKVATVSLSGWAAWRLIKELYEDVPVALDRKAAIARRVLSGGEPSKKKDFSHVTGAELVELRERFGTWIAVAEHLGVNVGTIMNIQRREGVPHVHNDWSWLTREVLEQLRSEEPSWNAVARRLGIWNSTLIQIRRRLNLL